MKAVNWTIPVILLASAAFYAIACLFLGSVLLSSPAGIVLSVVWWVSVAGCCAGIYFIDRRA